MRKAAAARKNRFEEVDANARALAISRNEDRPAIESTAERVDDPPVNEGVGGLEDDANDVGYVDIARVMEELEGSDLGSKVIINRLDRAKREKIFVDEVAPRDWSQKMMADNYGGGVYNVRLYVPQLDPETAIPNGRLKLGLNKTIIIDGPPKVRKDESLVPVAAPNQMELAKAIADSMREGFAHMAQLIGTSQPKAPTMLEQLQSFAMMKQVFSVPATDGGNTFKAALEMMKGIEEMRAMSGGGDNEGSGITGVLLGRFMDMFMQANKATQGNVAVPAFDPATFQPPAPPVLEPLASIPAIGSAPLASNVVPINQPVDSGEDDMLTMMYKVALADIVKKARANVPVNEYAQTVLDSAPSSLIDFLDQEDWWEQIQGLNADAKLYPSWFKALREEILRLDSEDEAEPDAA